MSFVQYYTACHKNEKLKKNDSSYLYFFTGLQLEVDDLFRPDYPV